MEKTLILIKPDGVERNLIGEIIGRIERKGFKISALKMEVLSEEIAQRHYEEHRERPFFPGLIRFMTSGPIVALIVEGSGAIQGMRTLMGCTNPLEALPGTIRGDLAFETSANLIHGSDSMESALRELQLFFSEIYGSQK